MDSTRQNPSLPVLVFGDGSTSVFLISQLLKKGESILWIRDFGSQIWPVMPHVKSELALAALWDSYQFHFQENPRPSAQKGTLHRVFRNKGFKMPSWMKPHSIDQQQSAFEEQVWKPEQAYLGVQEFRLNGMNAMSIEQELRAKIETHSNVRILERVPVVEFEAYDQGGKLQFSNGHQVEFKQLYYCGLFSELKQIPKLSTILKHQILKIHSSISVLQVVFQHSAPLLQSFEPGLVIPMNRDSGETFDRDVLGYFADSHQSVWTVFLQADEIEENHEIMKKLRKLKQSLNRAFDSPEFLPEGRKDFMSTVEKEQVRFEAGYLLSEGEFKKSSANHDFVFLNDSMGFSDSLEQIANHFGLLSSDFSLSEETNEILLNIEKISALPKAEAQF